MRIVCGGVAQLGEHLPCKQGVRSSTLLISTIGCINLKFLDVQPKYGLLKIYDFWEGGEATKQTRFCGSEIE